MQACFCVVHETLTLKHTKCYAFITRIEGCYKMCDCMEKMKKHIDQASHRKVLYISKLMKQHQCINNKDSVGQTVLMYAIEKGDAYAVEMLLLAGADQSITNKYGKTAMDIAKFYHVRIASILGYDAAALNHRNKLWEAIDENDVVKASLAIRGLCKYGAVDIGDESAMTPLMHAANRGLLAITEMLICMGADANMRNKNNWTALMYAVRYGSTEVTTMLLEAKADPNATDIDGWTPLHFAAKNNRAEIAKLLIHYGADVYVWAYMMGTPLDVANKDCNIEVVEVLEQYIL